MKKILIALLLLSPFFRVSAQFGYPPRPMLFNNDWQFVKDIDTTTDKAILGSKNASNITWENVTLPHTPRIEPIVKTEEQWQGTCYYRKYFEIKSYYAGKRIAVQFDAAMNDADVFVNGKPVYKHLGGYLPFCIDISKVVKYGAENCILVKLNNQDNAHIPPGKPIKDLDFNFYGGIYRDTWLIIGNPLHISDAIAAGHTAGGGVMLHDEDVTQNHAKIVVNTEVSNDNPSAKTAQVRVTLRDIHNKLLAQQVSASQNIKANSYGSVEQVLQLNNPALWSPMHPNLYNLTVEVLGEGGVVDEQHIKTGVKTFRFEPGAFYLNGEKLNLVGTNRHQEYPWVGYAISNPAQYRDAWKIKNAGLNFVRCSHYPPSPAFLDACDELGIMVMDAIPGWQFFGDTVFQKNSYQNIRDMIHRDRNHASIILWEASLNESGMSKTYMTEANRIVHTELPFKDVYSTGWIDYAYDVSNPARQHAKAPDYWKKYSKPKPLLLAEYGDWEYYAQNAGFNQKAYEGLKKEERNSRQTRADGETRMLQQVLNFQEAHNDDLNGPNVGDASWVMFDYKRGYAQDLQTSGLMDINRLPKFVYYFYQSQYGPQPDDKGFGKPMAFIASYWNDPATKTVKVFSNCDEVELILNGKSVARQKPDTGRVSNNLPHPPFTFAIDKFEPGKLEAIGYIKGVKAADTIRQTPGKPFAVKLWVDDAGEPFLTRSSYDLALVHANIVDENGTIIPDATDTIEFKISGSPTIVGPNIVKCEAGIATILIKNIEWPADQTNIIVTARAKGLPSASFTIDSSLEKKQ